MPLQVPLAVQLVALVVDQVRVLLDPDERLVGLALKAMVGIGVGAGAGP